MNRTKTPDRTYADIDAATRAADQCNDSGIPAVVVYDQDVRDFDGGYLVVAAVAETHHDTSTGTVITCAECEHLLTTANGYGDYLGVRRGATLVPTYQHSCIGEG